MYSTFSQKKNDLVIQRYWNVTLFSRPVVGHRATEETVECTLERLFHLLRSSEVSETKARVPVEKTPTSFLGVWVWLQFGLQINWIKK